MRHQDGGRHRLHVMVTVTAWTTVTRKCANVHRTTSNVLVTGLMMVVQGGGDVYFNFLYVMGVTTAVTGRMNQGANAPLFDRSNAIVTNLMIAVQRNMDACLSMEYAMGGKTVVIGRMRPDVSVEKISSNAIVTSPLMVVQSRGDA